MSFFHLSLHSVYKLIGKMEIIVAIKSGQKLFSFITVFQELDTLIHIFFFFSTGEMTWWIKCLMPILRT